MKCPFCGSVYTHVKDSRASEDNSAIRRRRTCPSCESRFTTFERIHLRELIIIKQNNSCQPFDRDKMVRSIMVALRKRPITIEQIEMIANSIVYELENLRVSKVSTSVIGKMIMERLKDIDDVAYVRFASVYMNFSNIKDFHELIDKLIQ